MKDHTQYAETLALYALGALDNAEERADLEAHLRSCDECRNELDALRGDAALLALSAVGPAPPQRSRQRLLDAVSEEPRKSAKVQRMVIALGRPRWMTFAPIAAALLLAIFSLLLLMRTVRLTNRLEEAQQKLQQNDQQLKQAKKMDDLMHAPDAMHLTLVAVKTPPQPQIKMIYAPKKGGLLLMANNLEPLPPNKVYELWLIPPSGAPMPAGTFKPDAGGNAMMDHDMPSGMDAKAFAVTIEPEGGSQTPTMPIKMMPAS
jgi:anti-sigma-K factor RskA